MFKSFAQFIALRRPKRSAAARTGLDVTSEWSRPEHRWHLGKQRICSIVEPQLVAARATEAHQWHRHRPFVFGYIDALSDMHVLNNGKKPQGPESRQLSAVVLRTLMMDAWNDAQSMWLLQIWARQKRPDFLVGRQAAFDDYEHWRERPMMGIAQRLAEAAPAGIATSTTADDST